MSSQLKEAAVLKENIETPRKWQPITEEKRAQMMEKVAQQAGDGHLECCKTG